MIEVSDETIEKLHTVLARVENARGKVLKPAFGRALQAGKTEAKRKAVETYHIKPGEYKKSTYIKYQSEEHGEDEIIGTISFAGEPIPLIKYNVSPKTPSRKTPSAVVKKANSPVEFDRKKDVFVQQMGSGHIGIFKREDTGKIKELYGPSTPKITENEEVIQAVTDKVNEVLNQRIEHEIERLFNSEG